MRVKSKDGTEITCSASGDGPPLVLVHGTGGSAARWEPLLPRLGERFTVYAMNRRGRGGSGDAEPYAIEREFEDVAALVDSLQDPVNLFGHSFGALCSLEASLLTGNLRRLVLYEPAVPVEGEIYPADVVSKLEELLEKEGPEPTLVAFMKEVVRMPDEEFEMFRKSSAWDARVAAAHTIPRELRATSQYAFRPARFANMNIRTMLMMGSESPPFLTHAARTVRMALPSATLAVLDGQQHVAMDTAPDLFLQTLLDFLG